MDTEDIQPGKYLWFCPKAPLGGITYYKVISRTCDYKINKINKTTIGLKCLWDSDSDARRPS
ncbi:hypothetical protein LCGC14_0479720 [marine sediment metagenome]|uniref:Uncharacterized protein n=1 Tax=marine sediment metagenome TaxID=412755 RepID=A0A0F9UWT6_9ZZZZ